MYVVSVLLILMGVSRLYNIDLRIDYLLEGIKKERNSRGLEYYLSDNTLKKIVYAGTIITALVMILGGGYIFIHL